MSHPLTELIIEEEDIPTTAPAEVVLEEGDAPVIAADDDDVLPPPPWTVNADGTRTLPLKTPVAVKIKSRTDGSTREKVVKELKLRRFAGGDMIALGNLGDNTEAIIRETFRRFTGEHDSIYDRMDQEDVMNFHDLVEDFLPKPRKGGKAISVS